MKSPMSPIRKLCCFSKPETTDHDPAGGDAAEEGEEVNAVQPTGTPPQEVVAAPVAAPVVASPEGKGHKRTPSEVAAPSTPVVAAAKPPTTPKVSRSGSSTSSYQSSASVQTAIERPPLVREASVESVITAIERTPSPKSSKKEEPASPLPTSQQSPKRGMSEDIPAPTTPSKKEDEAKSPKSPDAKSAQQSPKRETSEEPAPTTPSKQDESKSPKKEEDEPVTSPDAKSSQQSPKRGTSEEPAPSTPSKKEDDKSASTTPKKPELPEDVDTLDEVKKLNEIIDSKKFNVKHPFFDKISIHYGDITKIQVDAIVNAANDRLGGGGGVDGAIHRAAGHNQLQAECRKHDRPVPTGEAAVTDACKLSTHVKKIIHAVGPICYGGVTSERRKKLLSCYLRSMQLAEENGLRSIAFCCISTGIYGYDNRDAAHTVLKFLWKYFSKEGNVAKWDRVVLCLFMDIDKKCYQNYIREVVLDSAYFDKDEDSDDEEEEKKKKEEGEEDDEKDENKEEEKKDGEKEEENEGEKEKKDSKNEDNEKDEAGTKTDEKSSTKEEEKSEKSTVEGDGSKKEEAETSTNNTSASEKMEEEEEQDDGEKGDGEKENNEVDGSETREEGVTGKKRVLEEKEDELPMKRDKIERESAV